MNTIIICNIETKKESKAEIAKRDYFSRKKDYYLYRLNEFERQLRTYIEFLRNSGYSSSELEGLRNLVYDALFLEEDLKYKKDIKNTIFRVQVFLNTNSYFFTETF